ncbi:MAG: dihydrolipoyl dehydrogenase [Deltaproteobacteria bacterium]|nr:dihydrolipoyl dehydrogenase [Deltaproteobacteria bacterium]
MVMGEFTQEAQVLVIGSGPGGYAAAFRAADLGLEVTMVDAAPGPGGECLYRGCIPSKTLLSLAELIHDADRADSRGLTFGKPKIDLNRLRAWKDEVIEKLAAGLVTLSKKRGVQLIQGRAEFESSEMVRLHDSEISHIRFRQAILATGSASAPWPGVTMQKGGRIMDSTGALELADVPESLLIVGGGYIALEMGMVYASLGSRVTVTVRSDRLLRGSDADLVAPLIGRLKDVFEAVHFHTVPSAMEEDEKGVEVSWEGVTKDVPTRFDRVLVAVGRRPNTEAIGLEKTKVKVNQQGYVEVDARQRTADSRIFAVGDVAGGPLLAHKAFREGKVAAEVIAGRPSAFDVRAMPAVVYTDPQIAWAGLTEDEAKAQGRPVRVERYPWKFSSRATTMGASEGLTKMLVDPETNRVLGFGVVGRHAEGLISEGVLAVEMGALAEDIGLSIHPHPTLAETVGEVAEIFLGSATHLLPKQPPK